jgi:2-methylcitrate dehydratase PrpD
MTGLTQELARRAVGLSFDAFPDNVVHWAKAAIVDTLGVTIAGSDEPVVNLVRETLGVDGRTGPCRILGRKGFRAKSLDAALINGVAGHVHDFDDCSIILDGHPTVPMVPAMLALAEELDRSGREMIEAYVAGFEVEVHIARYLSGGDLRPTDKIPLGERGWHPTGVLGTLGCAIACARLLRLDADATAVALAVAASSAAGLRANSGTMTKSLHAGHASRNGLWAAMLASRGFTANREALEHRLGYFSAYQGPGEYGAYPGIETFGKVFELSYPGVSIKPYPCCSYTFPAIDAAVDIARTHGLSADDIAEVRVRMHERCVGNVDRPDPKTRLDAKFSTQYVTACGLLARQVVLEDFEGDAFKRVDVRDFMQRVTLGTHAEDDLFLGYVEIRTKDGRSFEAKASTKFGRGPDDPMPADDFKAKFINCASRILPAFVAEELFASFDRLEDVVSVRRVLDVIDEPAFA